MQATVASGSIASIPAVAVRRAVSTTTEFITTSSTPVTLERCGFALFRYSCIFLHSYLCYLEHLIHKNAYHLLGCTSTRIQF